VSSGTPKERLFDQVTSVMKMVLDGTRRPEEVSCVLQPVIDGAGQVFLPPGLQFRFFAGYNAWLKASRPEHAIPESEMTEWKGRLPGLPAEAMLFYCHRNAGGKADVVLSSQLAWEYACACRRTWKYEGVVFSTDRMKLADREPARPAGFYVMQLPEQDRKAGAIGKRFRKQAVCSVHQALGQQDWGMASEAIQIVAITNPHYPELMDGGRIPFIDLPGLLVDPRGDGGFGRAAYLDFDGAGLGLSCDRVGNVGSRYGSGSLQQC